MSAMRRKSRIPGVCFAWNVNKPGCQCNFSADACNFSHVCAICGSEDHRAGDCTEAASS
jgi:hypothetical protein